MTRTRAIAACTGCRSDRIASITVGAILPDTPDHRAITPRDVRRRRCPWA